MSPPFWKNVVLSFRSTTGFTKQTPGDTSDRLYFLILMSMRRKPTAKPINNAVANPNGSASDPAGTKSMRFLFYFAKQKLREWVSLDNV